MQNIFSIADIEYSERVTFNLLMPVASYVEAEKWLTDNLQKKISPEKVGEEFKEVII